MKKVKKTETRQGIKKSRHLYFIDLFSGAGGLSNGLEAAGFESILGIDNDKASIDTYKYNHKNSEVILGDIKKVTTNKIKKIIRGKKVSLICGGPPCQGFSTVGRNDPFDIRNKLFLEFVRIVRDLKPEYIIVENVTGLLSNRNRYTLSSIIKYFTDLGYSIDVRVLSAHHYGVPETRRRTIILGNKFGVENIYPKKLFKDFAESADKLPNPHTVKWAFENLVRTRNKIVHNHDTSFAEIKNKLELARISCIPQGKGVRYEEDQKKYLPKKLWFDIDWSNISEGRFRQTKLRKLSVNDLCPTINTSKTTYYHPTENRYLTPREAAAIQSFPPAFKFLGTQSEQWRQIGNAVPPLLAKAIGKAILKLDSNKHLLKKKTFNKNIDHIRSKAFNYKNKHSKERRAVQIEMG